MVKRRAQDDSESCEQRSSRHSRRKIQVSLRHSNLERTTMKDVDEAAAKIQAGFRGYKVRKELKEKEKNRLESEMENGPNDLAEESEKRQTAAAKIQAGVRGFLVRRRNLAEHEAAKKIQAGFRGFKVRKEVKSLQKP